MPRSARSATPCATCSANTRAARSSRRRVRGAGPAWRSSSVAAECEAAVEAKAKRTLVKSAPELWELADDPIRMESWMRGLLGAPSPIPVEVTDRDPERILAWRCAQSQSYGRIAIELAGSGFG